MHFFPALQSLITRPPNFPGPAGLSENAKPKHLKRGLGRRSSAVCFRCASFRFPCLQLSVVLNWDVCPISPHGFVKRQGWRLQETISLGVIVGNTRSRVGLQRTGGNHGFFTCQRRASNSHTCGPVRFIPLNLSRFAFQCPRSAGASFVSPALTLGPPLWCRLCFHSDVST